MTFAAGIPVTPEIAAAIHVGLADADRRADPVGQRLGLPQLHRGEGRPGEVLLRPSNYERLRRVKAEVDPTGLFRGNHAISAA